jgi:multiple sugar transport system ATP-binding protein
MAEVILDDVCKKFGDVTALDSLSLKVEDKEFAVLLGPSGCGKTTALRCIAGLETPDSGEIRIGETIVNGLAPKDRDIAMVFQSYALYPHKTVFDNLAFPLKVRKKSRQQIETKVKEVANLLRIEHLLNRRPKQLSGGEQQRVALGRALVREPKAFLMDEPLSNLDAKLRLYMRAELKRLHKELGITTVYVTHDQAEAMTMADKVAVMNNGVLQQSGTPDEVYSSPKNSMVAGFVGSPPMNFLSVTHVERNGEVYLDVYGQSLPSPGYLQRAIESGNRVNPKLSLGIRPEDMTISKSRTGESSIKMDIYVVEPLGSEIIVDLKLGDSILKARTRPNFKAAIGEQVYVDFDPMKMHLFDEASGERIS